MAETEGSTALTAKEPPPKATIDIRISPKHDLGGSIDGVQIGRESSGHFSGRITNAGIPEYPGGDHSVRLELNSLEFSPGEKTVRGKRGSSEPTMVDEMQDEMHNRRGGDKYEP